MHRADQSFEERLDRNPLEQQDRRVFEVLRDMDPGVQGTFDDYVVVNFTDGAGRFAEIRVMRDQDDTSAYTLNANVGSPLAMIEFFERLRASDVSITKMVSHFASKEENERLQQLIKE